MTEAASTRATLKQAIAAADLRVLLMVLVHMTGDLRWLETPFTPSRDIQLIPDASAGLPLAVQELLRASALEVLSYRAMPAIADPGDALMQRMMSVCLGEEVGMEYAGLTREEMGLVSRHLARDAIGAWSADRHVTIVGAGVSGIALAVSLQKLGVPFTIVERSAEVGGTWAVNRYPGCGVDTPNHAYAYSFGSGYPWPRYFSRREDVLAYLNKIVDDFGLRPRIRFRTELVAATWQQHESEWALELRTSEGRVRSERSTFLVSAIGQLSDPSIPNIDGAAEFRGEIFHSAHWPDGRSVADRRVAVIGTGATAMQLVPSIAGPARSVTVYQRTAQWARPIPGYASPIPASAQWLMAHVPYYAAWFRFNMFWRYGDGLLKTLRIDPAWPHAARSINKTNDRHRDEMLRFIREELGDRDDLYARCVPDYPPYGKRILLDNGWYRTLKRPDVELVVDGIRRITPEGVETMDGTQREADIIVYSTGFRMGEMSARLGIRGREGIALAGAWAGDNPSAYLGITVPRFPNLFLMMGPGTGPAHGGSTAFQAECQARYITSCIAQMAREGVDAIEVREEVFDAYNHRFDREHASLIWSHPGMSTYYRNAGGRVTSALPWRFVDYWSSTHDADLREYLLRKAPA